MKARLDVTLVVPNLGVEGETQGLTLEIGPEGELQVELQSSQGRTKFSVPKSVGEMIGSWIDQCRSDDSDREGESEP